MSTPIPFGAVFYPVYTFTQAALLPYEPESVVGLYTMLNADGTVVSIQPNGDRESRPAGTAGAYEVGVGIVGDASSTKVTGLRYGPYAQPFGQPPRYYYISGMQW